MSKFLKLVMFIGVIGYILSPADAVPGPVDDLIVMLLGIMANKKISKAKETGNVYETTGVEL